MPFCKAQREIRLAGLNSGVWLLPVFLALAPACAPQRPAPPPQKARGIFHVVRKGENLFRIGKAYGISYRELARINGIPDPDRVQVGSRIFIPGATRRLPVEIITPRDAVARRVTPGRTNNFIWPVRGEVSSGFGPRGENFHDGIDIAAEEGSPIRATDRGEVIYSDQLSGYGNLIIIRHSDGFASVYAHNRKNLVRQGQRVERGEVIGEVGQTGRVSAPHLHFEIRKDNIAVDPLYYLP